MFKFLRYIGIELVLIGGISLAADLPEGLMLNLDFRRIEHGLIPSKTLYPLYVPQGEIGTDFLEGRTVLKFLPAQSLAIPHSLLLDPDGRDWIVSCRVYALSDGVVISQGDETQGYIIYIRDGLIYATLHTGPFQVTLTEPPEHGSTPCINRWVTIELKIQTAGVILSLNRARVAQHPLQTPFAGENYLIRLGNPAPLTSPFVAVKDPNSLPSAGFSGWISSLKIVRQ